MNKALAPRHAAPPANRRQRRAMARKRSLKPVQICMAAAVLFAGMAFGDFGSDDTAAVSAEALPTTSSAVISAAPALDTYGEADTICTLYVDPLLTGLVDLDLTTQGYIYEMCNRNDRLFCAVMAIASVESHCDPDAIGDNGKSLGLMQINTVAQADRIERLGVTDLMDVYQNVGVAIDYMDWLIDCLNLEGNPYESHALYMAYNQGLSGYRNCGYSSSSYSQDVLDYYHCYMGEMGW